MSYLMANDAGRFDRPQEQRNKRIEHLKKNHISPHCETFNRVSEFQTGEKHRRVAADYRASIESPDRDPAQMT
ncbi:hypothetical protein PQQ51_19220 [Paraburkholderia xenovorans]|uniref:hypothetical protein n=1 Tax=Paraburkholderia xenovorans TaxID=36873 RepID=UPI0038BAF324